MFWLSLCFSPIHHSPSRSTPTTLTVCAKVINLNLHFLTAPSVFIQHTGFSLMNLNTYFNFSSFHSFTFSRLEPYMLARCCAVRKFAQITNLSTGAKRNKKKKLLKLNYDDDECLWQIEIFIFAMTYDLCLEACKQLLNGRRTNEGTPRVISRLR